MSPAIKRIGVVLIVGFSLLVLACSNAATSTPIPPAPTTVAQSSDTTVVLELGPIVASSDLSLGLNRFVFAILDSDSKPIRAPQAQISFFYLEGSQAQPYNTTTARFRQWPTGPGGVYTTQVSFDKPGTWGIEVSVAGEEDSPRLARTFFQVNEASATPPLGSIAPQTNNRTSGDVASLDELTSDPSPDPDLYNLTIAAAIATGKPTLVTFATPAFCTSLTCGPQVDIVKEIKNRNKGRANFIHVEIYDNPLEMRGDPSKGRLTRAVEEWALPSEPWSFILDGDGNVFAKFEAFTTAEELEGALLQVLQ